MNLENTVRGGSGRKFNAGKFFLRWEWMLVFLFVIVNIFNSSISSYYWQPETFMDAPMSFLDKAFMVMPMALVLLLGMIDISVGSTVALASVLMGVSYRAGMPMGLAMVVCLAVGTGCGMINGLILAKYDEQQLPSMIITLATMTIYRGLALIILKDQSVGNFPSWFSYLGWGYVGGVPFILIAFAVFAVFFLILLHKTSFGRQLYGMGNNLKACRYSGIKTARNKILVYTMLGFMAGVCALFLTSKMGSTRPNVANGYELEVIAMAALGGFSTFGGKGNMIGAILAAFIIGFLRYGLGLINASSELILIIIGVLLIASVLASNVKPKMKLPEEKESPEKKSQ
jgi:rhamnose transport system permease protein